MEHRALPVSAERTALEVAGEEDVCVASEEAEDASEEGVASAAVEGASPEDAVDEVESDACEAPPPLPQKVMRRLTWKAVSAGASLERRREEYIAKKIKQDLHHLPGTELAPGSRWR